MTSHFMGCYYLIYSSQYQHTHPCPTPLTQHHITSHPSPTPHTLLTPFNTLTLKPTRACNQNHNQTTQYQHARHQTHKQYTAPTRRELSTYDIVLRLKVSVETDEEHNDADADEGCAERLAEVAEAVLRGKGCLEGCVGGGRLLVVGGEGGV